MRRRFISKEEQEIIDLYNSGFGSVRIAKRFNCHDNTIRRYLRKNNISLRPHTKVSLDTTKEFVKLYERGLGTWKIAKIFNVGLNTVRYHLLKNLKLRPKTHISEELEDKFVEDFKKGLYVMQIGRKFNVPETTVRKHLISKNLRMRERGKKKEISPNAQILTLEKAYVLGVIGPGDGFLERDFRICLEAIDKDFIDYFALCLEKVYGIKPIIKLLKPRPTDTKPHYKVSLYSVEACRELLSYNVSLKEKDWRVPKVIKESSDEIKGMYLRGKADSQGSVCHKGTVRWVELSSNNQVGLMEIGELLNKLGVLDWYIHEHGVRISSRRSLSKFFENIGFIIERKGQKLKELLESYKFYKRSQREMNEIVPNIYSLWKSGLTYDDISGELKISPSTVYKYILRFKSNNSQEQIEFSGIR